MSTATAALPSAADLYVDPFPGRKGSERIVEDCGSCAGTGIYQGVSGLEIYTRTVGRVTKGCFACNGTGTHSFLVSSRRATARAHAKAAAASLVAQAEAAAIREAFEAANVEVLAWLRANAARSEFAASLLQRADDRAALSEAQVAAVQRAIVRDAEKLAAQAEAADLVEGRREIIGTVVSEKSVESAYGTTWKMVLDLGDGTRVYGSEPSSIMGEISKGVRVALTATIERSHDDRLFGFYSRPTKARVL